jgi:hypothetical protein
VAELGRPILLNPSCPPPPPGVEHAKKPEPFRALPTWPAENNGVDNHARLKKPAIGQIEVDLLAEAALGPNAPAVADDQHADHQLWIDRGRPIWL